MEHEANRAARVAVVMGSSRNDGLTMSAVKHLRDKLRHEVQLAELSTLKIEPFEYDRYDNRDDFRSVIKVMTESAHIVFATPVYWYSMSATMKVFFDRLTDLLHDPIDRKTGRALAGRNVWLLATGSDKHLPAGFDVPFARTAAYFAMMWRQAFYYQSIKGVPPSSASLEEINTLARLIDADDMGT
jgi:multimeric flavodoxin WrbA